MFKSLIFISKTGNLKPLCNEIFNLNLHNINRVSINVIYVQNYPKMLLRVWKKFYCLWNRVRLSFKYIFQILTCKFATVNHAIRNKIYSAEEAVQDIPNGSTLLVGGK